MRERLFPVLLIATCASIVMASWQLAQRHPSNDDESSRSIDFVGALVAEDWESRRRAAESLKQEHQHLVERLIRIVDEDEEEGQGSPRVVAARLLGDWYAFSAIPALSRHLDSTIIIETTPLREFYMEAYPCAEAISKMGPSALKPTLTAIAKQEEPLTPKSARVAAYLIVSLCDNSKEDAIAAIRKAEKLYPESKNLHPIRMYIEHFMDFRKNVERRHAEPSA